MEALVTGVPDSSVLTPLTFFSRVATTVLVPSDNIEQVEDIHLAVEEAITTRLREL